MHKGSAVNWLAQARDNEEEHVNYVTELEAIESVPRQKG